MATFELGSAPALVWWRPDATDGWLKLDHTCGGHNHSHLGGWVLPALFAQSSLDLLWALDGQEFASQCPGGGLAYEVAGEHRQAYVKFLESKGMKAGDLSMLQQAVYPLDTGAATLAALGVDESSLQSGAELLVLGWTDD
jgi:hypothetical protein